MNEISARGPGGDNQPSSRTVKSMQEIVRPRSMKTVDVTPEMAAKWLEENSKANCRHLPAKIKIYAADMKAGRWKSDNGEPVTFDWDGKINDGYHRLWAVVESGCTITFDIIENVNPNAYDTVDIGTKRTPGHVLKGAGSSHASTVSSGVRLVLMYLPAITDRPAGKPRNGNTVTNADILNYYRSTEHVESTAMFIHDLGKRWIKYIGRTHMFALAMLAQQNKHPLGLIKQFTDKLGSGADLSAGDPILQLRNRISETKVTGEQRQVEVFVKLIRAYNAWVEERTLANLYGTKVNNQTAYPDVVTYKPGKHRTAAY